jgi:hypothetical protein
MYFVDSKYCKCAGFLYPKYFCKLQVITEASRIYDPRHPVSMTLGILYFCPRSPIQPFTPLLVIIRITQDKFKPSAMYPSPM